MTAAPSGASQGAAGPGEGGPAQCRQESRIPEQAITARSSRPEDIPEFAAWSFTPAADEALNGLGKLVQDEAGILGLQRDHINKRIELTYSADLPGAEVSALQHKL